jgi:hypothetical protein
MVTRLTIVTVALVWSGAAIACPQLTPEALAPAPRSQKRLP